jgi:hypothetical protein
MLIPRHGPLPSSPHKQPASHLIARTCSHPQELVLLRDSDKREVVIVYKRALPSSPHKQPILSTLSLPVHTTGAGAAARL